MATLDPAATRLIVHWGEMGSRWGVNRTVAQVHALLYLAPQPLDAAEISETLSVARSNVSTALRELQAWGIVKVTHIFGDRRDYFESVTDIWELFRIIVEERWRREIEPTIEVLEECEIDAGDGDPHTHQRIRELRSFFESIASWYEQWRKLKPTEIKRVARAGSRVRRLLLTGRR